MAAPCDRYRSLLPPAPWPGPWCSAGASSRREGFPRKTRQPHSNCRATNESWLLASTWNDVVISVVVEMRSQNKCGSKSHTEDQQHGDELARVQPGEPQDPVQQSCHRHTQYRRYDVGPPIVPARTDDPRRITGCDRSTSMPMSARASGARKG